MRIEASREGGKLKALFWGRGDRRFLSFSVVFYSYFMFPFLLIVKHNHLTSSLTIGYAQRVSSHASLPADLHLILAELILFHHRAT